MHDPWQVTPGKAVDLTKRPTAATSDGPSSRSEAEAALPALQAELSELQSRLWAEGRRAVLVILQGMDASGKDGTIRHVFTGLNPQATVVAGFRPPSELEAKHDFLWRVHQVVPAAGRIGIFNRSHYEDVVTVRVRGIVPEAVWRPRFDHINTFEHLLTDSGTEVVKFFLHISRDEQAKRFDERASTPATRWKLSPEDVADRGLWGEFQAAYDEALTRTSTAWAPWRVVPADHKWFRNWVVSSTLVRLLQRMAPEYPSTPDDAA